MSKISIKKRLLLYTFIIQLGVIVIFSLSLYNSLYNSAIDKVETTLKIITLDIADNFKEEQKGINLHKSIDEEQEYQFRPLYIRIVRIDKKSQTIKSTHFPKIIKQDIQTYKKLKRYTISFENKNPYIICRYKIALNNKSYIIESATNFHIINSKLDAFLDKLIFLIPIIMILSMIGGYFLIYKSFLPIEKILLELKEINVSDLSKRIKSEDITLDEIGLLSKEINSLLHRLEQSFNNISQFSSDASHELKTPLTIIRGEIEVGLRKDRSTQEYKEILNNILDETLCIKETIDNLLFLAQSQHHSQKIQKNEIYIDEIIIESANELKPFAKPKNIEIQYIIHDIFQTTGHHSLFKIALKNIIKNAIVFSYKNSKIIIEGYLDKDSYLICVKDFGIGIRKNDINKVFDKFYRADKSRSKHTGGSGLGLSIAQKIIFLHNAKIEIESSIDKGTTVFIKFDLKHK